MQARKFFRGEISGEAFWQEFGYILTSTVTGYIGGAAGGAAGAVVGAKIHPIGIPIGALVGAIIGGAFVAKGTEVVLRETFGNRSEQDSLYRNSVEYYREKAPEGLKAHFNGTHPDKMHIKKVRNIMLIKEHPDKVP